MELVAELETSQESNEKDFESMETSRAEEESQEMMHIKKADIFKIKQMDS